MFLSHLVWFLWFWFWFVWTDLCEPSLQDVVGGDLQRPSDLQVLEDQLERNLRKHLLDLLSQVVELRRAVGCRGDA